MLRGKQVKIIKRRDRGDAQAVGSYEKPTVVRDDRDKTKRDAVTIVTEWVSELRRRKAQDAAQRFQGLFGKPQADS